MTAQDSHTTLPVVDSSADELWEVSVRAFADLVDQVPMVMTAHVAYPALSGGQVVPATLSPEIVVGLLEQQLGFQGVVLSDEMGMAAISNNYTIEEAAIQAVNAGVDMILVVSDRSVEESVYRAVLQATVEGRIPLERIDEAAGRIVALKEGRTWHWSQQPAPGECGCLYWEDLERSLTPGE